MDVIADRAAGRPDAHRGLEQRHDLRRRASWAIGVCDPMPPTRSADMLAQRLAGLGIEQAHEEVVPLHIDAPPDSARRRAVVRGPDLHAPIQMYGPDAEAVIGKRLERQRAERGLLLGKHRGHLAFRRALDPRVGPVHFPAMEIRLHLVAPFEAESRRGPRASLVAGFAPVRVGGHLVENGRFWVA